MRTKILLVSIAAATLIISACKDFLEIEPLDRVPASQLFSDVGGIKTVLATIYNAMPMEDFNWNPKRQFNSREDDPKALAACTEEAFIINGAIYEDGATASYRCEIGRIGDNYWDYQGIRFVNQFFNTIKQVPMDSATYNKLEAEAHFIRAYMYFTLAKRFGGVPIITEVQTLPEGGDLSGLYIPRSTEKATWDFVLAECDLAIANLPPSWTAQEGLYRATKWAAYALKARVALHAASVAKYWNNAPLTGDAVDQKLVGGMTSADADNYYLQCINAAKYVIDNSGKQLYKPNPATAAEAAKNYQSMFENPPSADIEIIYKKTYIEGIASAGQQGHVTDAFGQPQQTKMGEPYNCSRYSVSLDLADVYEDYTDNGIGASAPLVTRTDGVEGSYLTTPGTVDVDLPFKYYNDATDIFANKDARMHATMIVPGSTWKNVKIIMQAGLIKPDGSKLILTPGSAVGLDGKTYYSYGAQSATGYSGFDKLGQASPNYSNTGFSLKKYLNEVKNPTLTSNSKAMFTSTQAWIDFRLAEMYLCYAEAAIESGQGDAALAATYLNAIRKRAGHTDNIPATIQNIMKEWRIEFALENQRYWSLHRRREMHTLYNSYKRKSLLPVLDLRQNPPKYIFLRAYHYYDQLAGGRTFISRDYYLSIPGFATNKLVQNPGY